jgi:hypothetical protein
MSKTLLTIVLTTTPLRTAHLTISLASTLPIVVLTGSLALAIAAALIRLVRPFFLVSAAAYVLVALTVSVLLLFCAPALLLVRAVGAFLILLMVLIGHVYLRWSFGKWTVQAGAKADPPAQANISRQSDGDIQPRVFARDTFGANTLNVSKGWSMVRNDRHGYPYWSCPFEIEPRALAYLLLARSQERIWIIPNPN